ncbi:MAG: trigger factor [Syntrophomonas sp.]
MEARLEKIENSEAFIEIEVTPEKVEEGMQQAYRKVVKQVNVPGFRKGKVPRELLERYYGKEVLFQESLEFIVPDAYEQAIEELNIEPLAQPEFDFPDDIPDMEEGENFHFTVRVAVKPDVILGDFENLEVSIPQFTVKEEDVNKRLEDMQKHYAQVIEKDEETAVLGDTLLIDFEGFVDGVPFDGGKGTDYSLQLGSNTFIPGFEDQLVGTKKGDSKDVLVTFPESYHAPDLAGKEALFKVNINKVEGKQLRALDDDFAQEVSQFETIGELRDDIRQGLEEMAGNQRKELLRNKVMEKAMERCEIPIADAVIKMQVQNMLQEFEQRIAYQGLTLEQYYQITNSSEEAFSQRIWPEAEKMVKSNFMLEKLVNEKGFEPSDEEINKRVEEVAGQMQMDVEDFREKVGEAMENLISGLKMDKAVDYLIGNTTVTEITPAEDHGVEQGE